MSSGVLDPEVTRLEREVARRPSDVALHLDLARLRLRLGDRSAAFAGLDAFLGEHPSAEIAALHRQVLTSGRFRARLEPIALQSPDTGKPRTRHAIHALALDPGETQLALGKGSGDVWVVPLAGGEPRYLGRAGKNKSARAMAFLPDGSAFYSAGADGSVRRWDLSDGAMTKVSKKLDSILEAVAVHRGGVAAASISKRFRISPEGVVQEEASLARAVARTTAAASGPGDPLEDLAWEARGEQPGENISYSAYWQEYAAFDLHGSAVAFLREGELKVHRNGAWREFRDPRLVVRAPHALAPCGRAFAIGQFIRVIQQRPTDPPSRGLRLCFLEEDLRVQDLMEEDYVSCVAFSPSGGLLAVGTVTGHLWVIPLLEEERPDAAAAPESTAAPTEPAWETAGTRALRVGDLAVLGRYGEDGSGFGKIRGMALGMSEDVVLVGKVGEDGRVTPGPTCLSLKSGTFEPTDRFWSHRRFPHHRAPDGRNTPEWFRRMGERARYWVQTSDGRHAAVLIRGAPRCVYVVLTSGKGEPARLEAGGDVARVAWSVRGRRLAVLRRDGAVEVYGGGSRSLPVRDE